MRINDTTDTIDDNEMPKSFYKTPTNKKPIKSILSKDNQSKITRKATIMKLIGDNSVINEDSNYEEETTENR